MIWVLYCAHGIYSSIKSLLKKKLSVLFLNTIVVIIIETLCILPLFHTFNLLPSVYMSTEI